MNSSRNTTTDKSSKGRPPLVPPRGDARDDDAEARRARRSEVLLDALHRKRTAVSHRGRGGVLPPSNTKTASLSAQHAADTDGSGAGASVGPSVATNSSRSSESTSTIVTRSKSKALATTDAAADKHAADDDGIKLLSPPAFKAYRDSIGYVAPLPVRDVQVDSAAKSPGSSTIGSLSVLSHTMPTRKQLFGNRDDVVCVSDDKPPAGAAGAASDTAAAAAVAEDDTESALLEFFDNSKPAAKNNATKSSSGKKKKKVQPSQTILRELRRVAAFDAQTFVSTKYEKTSKEGRERAIEEQFYGNERLSPLIDNTIKGTLSQLVRGEGAYAALFDEGDGIGLTRELILKTSLCGTDSASRYVAGEHFTSQMISEFGTKKKKKVSGRQLWDLANGTTKNLKKALALVKKLDNVIVVLDDHNNRVIDYMSGKNQESFFRSILNGMWQLHQAKKKRKSDEIDNGE